MAWACAPDAQRRAVFVSRRRKTVTHNATSPGERRLRAKHDNLVVVEPDVCVIYIQRLIPMSRAVQKAGLVERGS